MGVSAGQTGTTTPSLRADVRYARGTTETAPDAEFAPPAGTSKALLRSANV